MKRTPIPQKLPKMKQTTKVIAVVLFAAFVLTLVLVSSASSDVKLRGGSPSGNGILRDAQLLTSFPGFVSFLSLLLRRIVAWILSLPTALFQYIISWFFFVWDLVFGALLSLSSPFATTTTTTLSPMTSQPQTTTTSVLTSLGSMTSPTVASSSSETSMMSSMSSTPTAPITTTTTTQSTTSATMVTSTLLTTSTAMATTMTTTPKPFRTVFITSQKFDGNLGGLEGADMKCSEAAMAGNLTGKFFAWLSNATDSPNTRFTRSNVPYEMIGGTRFADNYTALVAGNPLNALNIQEDGQMAMAFLNIIWTGTGSDGNLNEPTCGNWTTTATSMSGTAGYTTTPGGWTGFGSFTCASQYRLYCFEQ